LEADALNALCEVLPSKLHQLFEATSMRTKAFTTILKTDLSFAKRIPTDDGQDAQSWPEFVSDEKVRCNVDRGNLCEIALLGLEDCCYFSKELTSYESTAEGVVARFADGTSATGDVLVGADGIRSVVRPQWASKLTIMDAGTGHLRSGTNEVAAKLLPTEAL
jgi:2-polyprenyl-6-methoxyphenol hydroxylase-like FAD-dependent oxidoreductase